MYTRVAIAVEKKTNEVASHSCLPESVWVKRNCVAERLVLEAESITKKSRKHEMNNLSHQAPDEQ